LNLEKNVTTFGANYGQRLQDGFQPSSLHVVESVSDDYNF